MELDERFFEPKIKYEFKDYISMYTKKSVDIKIKKLEKQNEILMNKIIRCQELLTLN